MKYSSYVRMTPSRVVLNEKMLTFEDSGKNLLLEIYRKAVGDWPKFFKMDPLSKVGFVSTELLLSTESPRVKDCEDRAVILFNRSGSLADDRIYEGTIRSREEVYPSPAVFVYTLPNILTGEIAMGMMAYSGGGAYGLPVIHLGPVGINDNLESHNKMENYRDNFRIYGERFAAKALELFPEKN
jgi:3-oxoacyl-[acyl-carrier-protein] synthase-1